MAYSHAHHASCHGHIPLELGRLPPPPALAAIPLISGSPNTGATLSQPVAAHESTSSHESIGVTAAVPNHLAAVPLSSAGFSLSPATEPFPQKLVDKVRSGQFVEMRELMTDNRSLLQQLASLNTQCSLPALPGVLRPSLREVTSLPSWIYCFLAYIAMRAPDQTTRDMLAYARLVVREAQRHGGSSWLDYDRVFRQQAALDPTMRWNTLQPGIQAATLTGRATGRGTFCTLCREPDHMADRCALAYLQQPVQQPGQTGQYPQAPARQRFPPRRRPDSNSICLSWNKGNCLYPGRCAFRHVCATCQRQHMARDCADTPANSHYRLNYGGRPLTTPTTGRPPPSQPN